jgi:hypothetical protein
VRTFFIKDHALKTGDKLKSAPMSFKTHPQHVMQFSTSGPVSLKAFVCILFIFFNRATRIFHNGSMLSTHLSLADTALLPLIMSAALHVACLGPGVLSPTRAGRIPVVCAILHVSLLHALAIWVVTLALTRYTTTASFTSIMLASHLCFAVRPTSKDLVPAQRVVYGFVTGAAAYALPLLAWVVLPILRVHELEAIVLLFVPEALCFMFACALQFVSTVLHIGVTAAAAERGANE